MSPSTLQIDVCYTGRRTGEGRAEPLPTSICTPCVVSLNDLVFWLACCTRGMSLSPSAATAVGLALPLWLSSLASCLLMPPSRLCKNQISFMPR